jgi:hypothetical protein
MKKILLTLLYFTICFIYKTQAQIVIDTSRIDTLGAGILQQHLFQASSITGQTATELLHPLRTRQLCFDTRIVTKANLANGSVVFTCVYFNKKDGYVATARRQLSLSATICDINTNDPDFFLTVTNLNGISFTYSNLAEGNALKHYVYTAQTERNPYLFFSDSLAHPPLLRKIGTRRYCNNKLLGVPYKLEGVNMPMFYLLGQVQPAKVRYKKYLGHGGLGWYYGEDGLFFSLQVEANNYNAKVLLVEQKNVCIDVDNFIWKEGEAITQMRTELDRKLRHYNGPIPIFSGGCVDKKIAHFNKEKILINKQNDNLVQIENGNINFREHNNNLLMAVSAPIEGIDADIAKLEIALCNAQNIISNTESKAKKIRCINERLANLNSYRARVQSILNNNRYDKTKAYGEILLAKTQLQTSNECLMY